MSAFEMQVRGVGRGRRNTRKSNDERLHRSDLDRTRARAGTNQHPITLLIRSKQARMTNHNLFGQSSQTNLFDSHHWLLD